jgi:hypothetical protein
MLQLNGFLEQLGLDALLGSPTEHLVEFTDIVFPAAPSPGQPS